MENYILLLILLVFSFIFSGFETAFFSLSAHDRESIRNLAVKKKLYRLWDERENVLGSILFLNLLVNSFASLIFTSITASLFKKYSPSIESLLNIALFTPLLLFLGEITPKMIALTKPVFFVNNFIHVISVLKSIIKPITISISWPFKGIRQKQLKTKDAETIFKEFKESFPSVKSVREAILLSTEDVKRIMTKEKDIVFMDYGITVQEALHKTATYPHRYYICSDKKGEVKGILDTRELTHAPYNEKINTLLKEAWFFPETATIREYIKSIKRHDIDFAVIINEYGDISGIISMDDLWKLFTTSLKITKLDDNEFIVDADTFVDEIERETGIAISSENDTVAGIIMAHAGGIPEEGETIFIKGIKFEILKKSSGVIEKVKIKL